MQKFEIYMADASLGFGRDMRFHMPKPKHYKLIFHYMSGEDYVANKVTEYDVGKTFDGCFYTCNYKRRKNKFTTEDVTIPLHDCIAIEIWDNDSGEVVVKRNPQFDVVVEIDVTTNRRKIKRNNCKNVLQGGGECDTIGAIENESDNQESVEVTSYLGN